MAVLQLESGDAVQAWLVERLAHGIVADSRRVAPGDAFLAWPGRADDGRRHVGAALAAGASACLIEADGSDAWSHGDDPRVASLHGLKAAAGDIASRWLGSPSARLRVVAVTGTNGKTSTAWWVAQSLGALGRRAGVIGTLGVGEPPGARAIGDRPTVATPDDDGAADNWLDTGLTTPDAVALQTALRDFVERGYAACAIEASSIGLAEHRLDGTDIAVAVFTNFTQDHLDFHGDMTAYWEAKARLFAWPGLAAAVINVDDEQGSRLAAALQADVASSGVERWTVSRRGPARLVAADERYLDGGLAFEVREGDASARVATRLIGDYNVANLLGVIGALRALGIGLAEAAAACATLTPVPGRLQRVRPPVSASEQTRAGPEVIVDYAHTPDALDKVLVALAPLARARGGQLWCVFGCGGNRDTAKRPLMGAIAGRRADRVVVTSDNPRDESADFILSQILAGIVGRDDVDVFENRAEAIRYAVRAAAASDVVLVAGKGHERTQEIAGVKLPFSDTAHAAAALASRGTMASVGELAQLVPGSRLVGDAACEFRRVHSDTRTLRAGDCFVALRGERFDGNAFLAEAKAQGAVAAIAERGLAEAGLAGIEVDDARAALGTLATAWRARSSLPLVVVAGSNGKTTVTQMIASILRLWLGDEALATAGNFNNDIGVPLTLLRLRDDGVLRHRAAVVELGMNHPGEIAHLAAIARPTVALVNNAQREHLEFMASVEAVAAENGAAIAALPESGIAVFPADDAHAPTWRALAGARRVVTFAHPSGAGADGSAANADVTASATWQADRWSIDMHTPAGDIAATLHVAGEHNVRNALAATAAALAAGAPPGAIAAGLSAFAAVKGRSQTRRVVVRGRDATLVDDTYNANPDSVRAAIDVLATLPAPRWLVLGDMGEVGDQGPAFHREAGDYAHRRGIDALWAAGAEAPSTIAAFPHARAFADVESLVAAIGFAPVAASILVKGSRFMRMERVVAAIAGEEAGDAHAA